MIFSQVEYICFFATVWVLHWTLPRPARIWLLLISSLLFYGTWNFRYLGLMLFSAGLDYLAGVRMADTRSPRVKKAWLACTLTANLLILSVFKYYGFFVESVAGLLGGFGFEVHFSTLGVLLPVGISFYTFQSMSYAIDVYRGREPAERSFLYYMTFVSFFPQLVAGPIVRAENLIGQLRAAPPLTVDKLRRGGKLFLWGLFKKSLFADLVAIRCVDLVFADVNGFDTPTLWLAALGYSLQIYADFSGYSDMARGSALMLGYELPLNFETPYRSRSITEFWRRWHISLSTWLRDYLYISLGGNRGGRGRTFRNLMITMLLGGLWHGANWTFVVWGGAHGLALIVHRVWRDRTEADPAWAARRESWPYQALSGLLTFWFVCMLFVLFRTPSFGVAADMFRGMYWPQDGRRLLDLGALVPVVLFAAGTVIGARVDAERLYGRTPWPLRSVAYVAVILLLLLLTPVAQVPFVYFQF